MTRSTDLLRFTTAGSVDDGKSTLIGRLLFDSKALFADQLEALERASRLRGEETIDLSLVTDGLRAEREQRITIDVAYRYFATPKRSFIIADTPGHEQYTRNMVTGASTADLAVVLIDARNGVVTQSKRHGFIASLLGIPHLIVAVNKMDLVDWSEDVFAGIVEEYTDFSRRLDIHDIRFVPVSALLGDNVVGPSARMDWYSGKSVLGLLETVTISADRNLVDFRFPVQTVIRPNQDFRGVAGTVASGTIRVGEEVVILPSLRRTRVASIHTHRGEMDEAFESQAVVLRFADQVDAGRGDMVVRTHNVPSIGDRIEASLCWMDEHKSLQVGGRYRLQHTTHLTGATVRSLHYLIDVNSLHREKADTLRLNDIGRVELRTAAPIYWDAYRDNRPTGGFILIDESTNRTVAAGMIRAVHEAPPAAVADPAARDRPAVSRPVSPDVVADTGGVTREEREAAHGHKALVVWFTGLSGAGKSTIARALERRLFVDGRRVVRLDGDNLRHGLNGDLGFSADDRRENIRRAAEVARLFFETGALVLCSFVSPFATDRDFARCLVPEGRFVEVYVRVDLETARARDPKGLYARSAAGELSGLTGVDAPYEEPVRPEAVVDTAAESADVAVGRLYDLVERML